MSNGITLNRKTIQQTCLQEISPQALKICEIWWRGPNWLAIDAQHWPTQMESEFVVVSTLIKIRISAKSSFIEVFIDRQSS